MILSVSRRTDIPNYYSEWLVRRFRAGFLCVRNPMDHHQVSRINLSPELFSVYPDRIWEGDRAGTAG